MSSQAQVVEWHKDAVGANKRQPEMKLTQLFAHHATSHFRKPEISPGEYAEDGSHSHHHVEMSNHEGCGMQVDIDGRLRQEKSADAAADEHRNESQSKERCGGNSQPRSVQTAQPDQSHDRGRNRDD